MKVVRFIYCMFALGMVAAYYGSLNLYEVEVGPNLSPFLFAAGAGLCICVALMPLYRSLWFASGTAVALAILNRVVVVVYNEGLDNYTPEGISFLVLGFLLMTATGATTAWLLVLDPVRARLGECRT